MQTKQSPVNVFIDSDLGWDDWCAISLLAQSSATNIVGLSVTGCGEAYFSPGLQNALDILNLLECNAAVGKGATAPTAYSNVFPSDFRKNVSSLFGYTLQRSSVDPLQLQSAEVVLSNALKAFPDLIYLSIGGFTNLYNYLMNDKYNNLIPKSIVAMCGAVNVPGNINSLFSAAYPTNKVAEWNIFIDPVAAQYVIKYYQDNNLSLRISPLDASYQVPLAQNVVHPLVTHRNQDALTLFLGYVLSTRFNQSQSEGYPEYFYDPLAAWTIIDAGVNVTYINGDFSVNTDFDNEESSSLGQLTFKANPSSLSCYGLVNSPNAFYTTFINTILQN